MRNRRSEKGIALLISIFVLLLIGVMGIALIVSSGSETALAGNYRASTNVYYAAVAGLEEVRSRLRNNTPNSFQNTAPANFLPAPGTAFPTCNPSYVINPLAGEAVVPWDQANPYFDNEFGQEFGGICPPQPPSPSPNTPSVWNTGPLNGLGFPGPMYKWVRINGVTEQSLNLNTTPIDGIDPKPIYYDGTNLTDTATGNQQVLEVTALAVLPGGDQNHPTRKLVQYLIAPLLVNIPTFRSALTLLDNQNNSTPITFSASQDPSTNVRGIDQDDVGSCTHSGAVAAIGVFTNSDKNTVINGILPASGPLSPRPHYTGSGSTTPDVQNVSTTFQANLQNPPGLETSLVQPIIQNADVTLPPGPVSYPSLPTVMGSTLTAKTSGMSPTNPMTIVINGNLNLTSWNNTGYGLLLVRGNLTYDPTAYWRGIILVIGQGTVTGSGTGEGDFDGAVLIANTLDQYGNLLSPNQLTSSMDYSGITNGEGIHFSHCWVKAATPAGNIKILSFHEIAQ